MLFSEPKIPQFVYKKLDNRYFDRFSALQRAENSSIVGSEARPPDNDEFQCSSASRKFLNCSPCAYTRGSPGVSVLFSEPKIPQLYRGFLVESDVNSFSALQRAENSSIDDVCSSGYESSEFQCSSASRKFLNRMRAAAKSRAMYVSVLFSEPKIPQ